ncbi:hypothetical protein J7E83_20525 [Arthrobacter sp. ISL-48]|uniref:hypothetical protein n=1 Tax=Arthrobacter sp. ISL-48 TaxID=2819110 RepID=UPI001BE7188B|nr:hypothetical protein [Arthrobacter sp. ISL-48]MBT2534470.1 hypothetical protein [Arthrobacter sp. ISL-48]
MDMSRIFRVLWESKWLAVTGVIVAVLVALAAGFRVEEGSLKPRAERSFTASTQVMLSGAGIPLYQAQAADPALEGGAAPREQNLSTAAVMFAYIISGSTLHDEVTKQAGPLTNDETINAVQRTTQPSGSEEFPGRLNLPIVEIHGTAATPERAVQLAQTTTEAFHSYVLEQQESAKLAPDARVVLADIRGAAVTENDVSSVAAPLIAVGGGTFLAFIALIFILDNKRRTRTPNVRRSVGDPEPHGIDGASAGRHEVLEPASRR